MKELLEEIRDNVEKLNDGMTELLISDGRKHERIKSLEFTRKWTFNILGGVIIAVIVGVFI